MGGLRKIIKKTGIAEEEDVEAQSKEPRSQKSLGGHDPLFLAKVILQKVFALITADEPDEKDEGGEGGEGTSCTGQVIIMSRDVVLGIIMGVLTISILIFLDHRDIVHMQTAHNYRETAFSLLNDPETIATLEESSGMHFLSPEQYESMMKGVKAREDAAEREIGPVREEHTKLMSSPILGFDKFCGECQWDANKKITCEQRFQEMLDMTHLEGVSKIGVMDNPACKKEG